MSCQNDVVTFAPVLPKDSTAFFKANLFNENLFFVEGSVSTQPTTWSNESFVRVQTQYDLTPVYIAPVFSISTVLSQTKGDYKRFAIFPPAIHLPSTATKSNINDYYSMAILKNLFKVGRKEFSYINPDSVSGFNVTHNNFAFLYEYSLGNKFGYYNSFMGKQDSKSSFEVIEQKEVVNKLINKPELQVRMKITAKLYDEKGTYKGELKDAEIQLRYTVDKILL
jgi:hypothetical protein